MEDTQKYVEWKTKKFEREHRNLILSVGGLITILVFFMVGPLLGQLLGWVALIPLFTFSVANWFAVWSVGNITKRDTLFFIESMAKERVEAYSK